MKQIEHERRKWSLLAQQEKDAAQKAADKVKGVKITIEKRVGEHGHHRIVCGPAQARSLLDRS